MAIASDQAGQAVPPVVGVRRLQQGLDVPGDLPDELLAQPHVSRHLGLLAPLALGLAAETTPTPQLDRPDPLEEGRVHRLEERLLLLGRGAVRQPLGSYWDARQHSVGRVAAVGRDRREPLKQQRPDGEEHPFVDFPLPAPAQRRSLLIVAVRTPAFVVGDQCLHAFAPSCDGWFVHDELTGRRPGGPGGARLERLLAIMGHLLPCHDGRVAGAGAAAAVTWPATAETAVGSVAAAGNASS